jgi:hypothetical protein
VREAGEKWGVDPSTVAHWIRKGFVPGAYKIKHKGSDLWIVPDDAACPRKIVPVDNKEAYILKHSGTHSIKAIAEKLGISTMEVRQIFDQLISQGRVIS